MQNTKSKKVASLVYKTFELEEMTIKDESLFLENLHQYLSKQIAYMLDREFEKLMQIFYRMDLNEVQVRKIIFGDSSPNVAQELATLVIKRQIQKVETWEKYS